MHKAYACTLLAYGRCIRHALFHASCMHLLCSTLTHLTNPSIPLCRLHSLIRNSNISDVQVKLNGETQHTIVFKYELQQDVYAGSNLHVEDGLFPLSIQQGLTRWSTSKPRQISIRYRSNTHFLSLHIFMGEKLSNNTYDLVT